MSTDPLREALAELVACKDIQDEPHPAGIAESDAEYFPLYKAWSARQDDYNRRKPLAWEAARRALEAAPPVVPTEPTDAALLRARSAAKKHWPREAWDEALASQPAPAHWISVEDRMPEQFVEVLIAFRDIDLPCTGQYTASPHDTWGWCFPSENDPEDTGPITHWMPLPSAPVAVSREESAPRATSAAARLCDEITGYLATGGLFNPEMANHGAVRDLLIECRAALTTAPVVPTEATERKMAPVQGWPGGIPWSLHLEAYAAYCKRWSPQPALIEGGCRGGFGTEELDGLIPGWRERVSEIAELRSEVAAPVVPTEPTAALVYEAMRFEQPNWVPWVEGGNSNAQEEARRIARRIAALASQPAPQPTPASDHSKATQPIWLAMFGPCVCKYCTALRADTRSLK